ncbi:ABC transporter permease [Sporolactobacillus spathodeae]|uniref:Simple sugar transport system permease protein n=1 Tax=Sporolactobacillus spathodeae TaxID=1465502 RepID=A0ABS2Q8H1_9BACL|nr:ABC transporter permease [Sporolactobacillus spathodeae]MBM7657735.1 simple sugar transport system permease protein [Sporolactobacillus spathodeae]
MIGLKQEAAPRKGYSSGKQTHDPLQHWIAKNKQIVGIFSVLVVLSLYFSLFSNAFATTGNVLNLLQQLAANLIVCVAMTLVITTSGIDLSVGSILSLASALIAVLLKAGLTSFEAFLVVLLVGAVVGLVNGVVIAYLRIPPFIVTLASMIYIQGLALLITGGYSISINGSAWLNAIGQGRFLNIPVAALIALFVVVFGWVVLTQTKFGTYIIGIGSNEESVRRAGVAIKKIKMLTYMFSGIAASFAGIVLATRLGSGSSNVGTGFEMDVIAAVVLGGTSLFGGIGTMLGSVFGVFLIGVIDNGLTLMNVSPYIIQIVQGTVLLVAVIVNTYFFSGRGVKRK